jgi:hypothetical protein
MSRKQRPPVPCLRCRTPIAINGRARMFRVTDSEADLPTDVEGRVLLPDHLVPTKPAWWPTCPKCGWVIGFNRVRDLRSRTENCEPIREIRSGYRYSPPNDVWRWRMQEFDRGRDLKTEWVRELDGTLVIKKFSLLSAHRGYGDARPGS